MTIYPGNQFKTETITTLVPNPIFHHRLLDLDLGTDGTESLIGNRKFIRIDVEQEDAPGYNEPQADQAHGEQRLTISGFECSNIIPGPVLHRADALGQPCLILDIP